MRGTKCFYSLTTDQTLDRCNIKACFVKVPCPYGFLSFHALSPHARWNYPLPGKTASIHVKFSSTTLPGHFLLSFWKKLTFLLLQLLLICLTRMHWSLWSWLVGLSYREPSSLSSPAFHLLNSLSSTSPSGGHLVHWTYHPFACLGNNPVSSLTWLCTWWR